MAVPLVRNVRGLSRKSLAGWCLWELVIVGVRSLTRLVLSNTGVTDPGLKSLSALERLTALGLRGTAVTDAGLKELSALGSLRTLHLRDTQVTEKGVEELRTALPKCQKIQK
jgi:hypothetical protein